jgi:FixJ family two-component response regulator
MNNADPIVYLVDDDPSVLKAVSRLLQAAGFTVSIYGSSQRFLDEYATLAPGCVVLDLAMPGLNGLDLQEALTKDGEASMPIIFLTGKADVPDSVRAMKRGAADFLTKPVERDELIPAVKAALAKGLAARQVRQEISEIRRRVATLTPREYEVFEHVIKGDLNKQTAADLGAAEKTIKIHRARVMQKMQVQSVAELVRLAEHAGIGVVQTL